MNNLSSFLNWLRPIMDKKNISQADLARPGYVTESAISLLFSMRTKKISPEMCMAIAEATNTPLITVYRKAGLLPEQSEADELIEQIEAETEGMTEAEKRALLAFVRAQKEMRQTGNNHGAVPGARPVRQER